MKLDEPGRLCHEGKGGNGWRMLNEVTQEDEICICPVVFERTATSNTLSSLPNTKESLKSRHIDDIKRYYAAGTLLHEISHCSTILGADRTRLLLNYNMVSSLFLTLATFASAYALAVNKRFDNGDFPTGDTDPNVTSACTYWANSISSTDTCADLESYYGITSTQLTSWRASCINHSLIHQHCVHGLFLAPVYYYGGTCSSPSPTQGGLSSSCDAFYYVEAGDSCWAIVNSYGNFTLNQFYSWNPAVKSDCSGLQPDYYVCIGVAGDTTVASQTTLPATTTASAATSTGSYLPEQTGIASNCDKYYYVQHGDTCSDIATNHDISLNDFYSWNPAVGTTCSDLEADYWVCVGVSGGATATTTTSTSTSTSTVSSTTPTSNAPSPTQSGLFNMWNPYVGSSCANLWLGYWVCVGV
ncbi:hypothetical protein ASPNIDRAFT_179830 [Aspergillus niger ATCC 1015]|uniref:LysM domain-containing protein n=1 Tax=Aspergillus niger (strain ATCC 1015 / CBS 113.46 / FGSC A1144 / LSHB Ac4 / NCTC 3858a / NRRL 328 / USDA 3528.7) TaxID=380704 RepID=G3YD46_ASPNA|nr:hypothetical protein ASPNIDRAFT_179830 [Aspergillus niger ATCC 1015]